MAYPYWRSAGACCNGQGLMIGSSAANSPLGVRVLQAKTMPGQMGGGAWRGLAGLGPRFGVVESKALGDIPE